VKFRAGLLAAFALALFAGRAAAQEMAPAHGQWIVDLGAAARVRPDRIGANTYTLDVLPVIDAGYGKRIRLSLDDGARWTAIKAGRFSFGPVAEYRQAYNDLRPPRTPKIADALETGVFSQVDLTYAVLEGRFRKALNAYYGYSGDLSLDTLIPIRPGLGFGLEARTGWADHNFTMTHFTGPGGPLVPSSGVSDYWSAGFQAGLIYRMKSGYGVTFGLSDDIILKPTPEDTNYRSRNALVVGIALTRRFMTH